MTDLQKPPTGLTPSVVFRDLTNRSRIADIIGAIERYNIAGKDVPNEWFDELKDRTLNR